MDTSVMTMIRKQLYIAREQDAKLKRLAASRGCTEAEVVRAAIEALPDPEPAWLQRLRQQGLIRERKPSPITQEERDQIQRELDAELESLHGELCANGSDPRLVEAILEERDESDRRF